MLHFFRPLAVLAVFFLFAAGGVSSVHAQETTEPPTSPPGFDNPDDVTDIDQYRLPSWSFTTVLLNLSGGAQRRSDLTEGDFLGPSENPENRVTFNSLDLNLAPSLETFTESEDRRFRLNVNPYLAFDGRGRTEELTDQPTQEQDERLIDTGLGFNVALTEYVAGDVFLQAQTRNEAQYRRNVDEATAGGAEVRDEVELNVSYLSQTRLGIGFGRLRDVTPVIRALRVRERLKELGRGDVLSSENIQAAAQQFARRPGYAPVYDRGDKYFWNDFFSGIEAQSGDLLPYESFYVAESLVEQVARRQEGYEVSTGLDLNYSNRLLKVDDAFDDDQRSRRIRSSVGLFAQGRYATNLSLRQQITVFGDAEYRIPTDDNNSVDGIFETRLRGRHLWEIADRYQVITMATTNYQRRTLELGDARTRFGATLSSDFAVFVENNVRLNAGLEYAFLRDDLETVQTTRNDIRFSFGVNYFLFRGLK